MRAGADNDATVVGAGISGLACARAMQAAGASVRVIDRGRRVGGRLASRTVNGRAVDIGASYFVAGDDAGFVSLVEQWADRGLARPWTDTFAIADATGISGTTTGPLRYAAPAGLRSLAVDLADGLDVVSDRVVSHVGPFSIDGVDSGEAVLAMPSPQARRLLTDDSPVTADLQSPGWESVIAVVLTWGARSWPDDVHGVFVNDHPDIAFIADDGDRRGDAAPVLVVHTTGQLAQAHLHDPESVIPPVVAATRRVLGLHDEPNSAWAHRWTYARPSGHRHEPFFRTSGLSICGDAWGAAPSVRTAWASGYALGTALAGR